MRWISTARLFICAAPTACAGFVIFICIKSLRVCRRDFGFIFLFFSSGLLTLYSGVLFAYDFCFSFSIVFACGCNVRSGYFCFFCVTAVGDHLLVHAQDITTLGMVASRRESFSKEELVRPDLSNIGEDILLRVHTHTQRNPQIRRQKTVNIRPRMCGSQHKRQCATHTDTRTWYMTLTLSTATI